MRELVLIIIILALFLVSSCSIPTLKQTITERELMNRDIIDAKSKCKDEFWSSRCERAVCVIELIIDRLPDEDVRKIYEVTKIQPLEQRFEYITQYVDAYKPDLKDVIRNEAPSRCGIK